MKFLNIGQLQLTFPQRKNDETYLFFKIFEKYKSQGIIQDFAAHCALQNERMAKGWKLKKMEKSEGKIPITIKILILILRLIKIFNTSPFTHFA